MEGEKKISLIRLARKKLLPPHPRAGDILRAAPRFISAGFGFLAAALICILLFACGTAFLGLVLALFLGGAMAVIYSLAGWSGIGSSLPLIMLGTVMMVGAALLYPLYKPVLAGAVGAGKAKLWNIRQRLEAMPDKE